MTKLQIQKAEIMRNSVRASVHFETDAASALWIISKRFLCKLDCHCLESLPMKITILAVHLSRLESDGDVFLLTRAVSKT